MTRPKNDTERREALLDVIEETILSASDHEIIEETRLEGRDPEVVAEEVRALINSHLPPKKPWWKRIASGLRPKSAISPGLIPLIRECAYGLVAQLAPQELPVFRATSDAFFENTKQWLKGPGRTAEMLAFGLETGTVSLTPAVLAATTEVVQFVAERVQESLQAESAETVAERVREMFKEFRSIGEEGKVTPPPLIPKQHIQVRQLAFEKARGFGLPEDQAHRLADALIESLTVIES